MNGLQAKKIWNRLSTLALFRFLLFLAAGWAIVQILSYFGAVVVVFTFAAIFAFLLSYPVEWLRHFIPHRIAVIIVFFLSIVILGILIATISFTVISQGQQLINSISDFFNSVVPILEIIEELLRQRNLEIDLTVIDEQLHNQILSALMNSLAIVQQFLSNIVIFILIAFAAFFMLLDGGQIWHILIKLIPEPRRSRFHRIIKRNFLGFLRGQVVLTLFLTSSTFVVFLLLRVPFPLLLSLIIGILDIIPSIGATLGVGIVTLIVSSQNVWLALQVLGVCIILQLIQDNLLAPRIMQGTLNLNPVLVIFALLIGARVAGLLGIIVSLPIAGVIVSWLEIDEMKSEVEGLEAKG